jgi:hypothetical protein
MRISTIICTRNRAGPLIYCLDSVSTALAQVAPHGSRRCARR